MIKDALKYLISLGNQPAVTTDYPSVVLPEGVEVKSLEAFQQYKNEFKLQLNTWSLKDFESYCLGSSDGKCFINRDSMEATRIFDIGNEDKPGKCNHAITIKAKPTFESLALSGVIGHVLDQQELIDFLVTWSASVDLFKGSEAVGFNQGISAIRRVTVETASKLESSIEDMSKSKSTMERVDVVGALEALPNSFDFSFIPYRELKRRTVRVDLRVLTKLEAKNTGVLFKPVSLDYEPVMDIVSEEFAEMVSGACNCPSYNAAYHVD